MYNLSSNRFSIALELSKYSNRRKVHGMFLGAFWSFLEPLLLFVILILLRRKLGNSDIPFYPLYLFIGLFVYQFFSQATRRVMLSLTAYARYAKTFPLPLDTYVYATFFEVLKNCSAQMFIIAGLLVWSGFNVLFLIPFLCAFLFFALFVLGVSFFLAGMKVYFRDLEVIWGLVCRVLFFATPIFYTVDFAPPVIYLNPLIIYLECFREILIKGDLNLFSFVILFFLSAGFLMAGKVFFGFISKNIVEEI